jgi:hypothetical protein
MAHDGGRCRYTEMGCTVHTGEKRRPPGTGPRLFSDDEVRFIRLHLDTHAKTADRFGVSPSTIGHIRQRRIYKEVIDDAA